jgi:hypothetical protein
MSALNFYMHDGPKTFRFELAGNLAGAEVRKLDQAWRTAASTIGDKILAVDLTFLTSADEKGRDLVARWWRAGAHFVANSPVSRNLVESITGMPYLAADPAVGPTFNPSFLSSSLRAALFAGVLAVTLLFPSTASAASAATSSSDASSAVLERYSANLAGNGGLYQRTAAVEIDASLPRFEKQARVEAIRRWNDGKRQYQFVTVEGDSFIRHEMIARYFAIDSEGGPVATAITKANYKFRFVGTKETGDITVSVFQITPRKKRQGRIAGELWIDNATGLVTHLAGRVVKSPSLLLRRVDISQEMQNRDGVTFARETHLQLNTRFAGRADVTIREHTYAAETAAAEVAENVTP